MLNVRNASAMRQQVYSLPSLIREQLWPLEARVRKVLTTPEIYSLRSVLITGSGDSHMAGLAAAAAFVEFAGILPHVFPSMQAARYVAPLLGPQPPNTPLVIAVSSSGEVARVVEAVSAFNRQGALTLAVTAQPASRLAQASSKVLGIELPPFASAPGVRSYTMSLLALQLLAIRLAEVRGRITMDAAFELRRELASGAEVIEQALPAVDESCRQLALAWRDLPRFEILGSGPHAGTAAYGAAKLLEAVGCHACSIDVEEWNHLNYFTQEPGQTGTWLLADPSFGSFSRACEVAGYLQTLGRPYVILGNMSPEQAGKQAALVIPVPAFMHEALSPVVYSAALALFAAYLNETTGAEYGRGSSGPWEDSRDGNAVRNSTIVLVQSSDAADVANSAGE
jgi:glucosamine--fructose-6-phosphate aminotransferase (isomerizing)